MVRTYGDLDDNCWLVQYDHHVTQGMTYKISNTRASKVLRASIGKFPIMWVLLVVRCVLD